MTHFISMRGSIKWKEQFLQQSNPTVPEETNTYSQTIACEECGLVVDVNHLQFGEMARCPRCNFTLINLSKEPFQTPIAYSIAALIALIVSLSFPFMSFTVQGLSQKITLLGCIKMLSLYHNNLLAILIFVSIILLPALYLIFILDLHIKIHKRKKNPHYRLSHNHNIMMCKALCFIKPWLMVDVFLVGVLISLIKISSLADIGMGLSFWAFCFYTALTLKSILSVNTSWLWDQLIKTNTTVAVSAGDTFQQKTHLSCHTCTQINAYSSTHCTRCHSPLHHCNPKANLQKAWAFLITAIIFYLPANLYPIMYTVSLGQEEGSTIMEGVILLWQLGSYPIAMIIFLASVLIPLIKMLALSYLFFDVRRPKELNTLHSTKLTTLYRITELIGRWSMIDIFVVAILVALVQLDSLMAIYPGRAALSFAIVVISTMVSALIFDSRIIWRQPETDITQQPNDHTIKQ